MKNKQEIVERLRKDILRLQGYTVLDNLNKSLGLGPLESAFPNQVFPRSSVHEFICESKEQSAVTCGFVKGLLSRLMPKGGVCVWIDTTSAVFPPAAPLFDVEPAHIIFIQMPGQPQALWAVEEALKCNSLSVVVGELYALDFVQSRRLQLAVEKSKVTALIMRKSRNLGSTSCAARWKINALPSIQEEGLPGIGYPRWQVELLKVRNGNPGRWELEWSEKGFHPLNNMVVQDNPSRLHIQVG